MSDPKQDLDKDPVVHSSLSKPLYVSSVLLVLCTLWALYDEVYAMRPWKSYQRRFARAYSTYLRTLTPKESASERKVRAEGDYRRLEQERKQWDERVAPKARAMEREINQALTPKILALNEAFQVLRSEIGALTYKIEVATSEDEKNSLRRDIGEIRKRVELVALPAPDGSLERKQYSFPQMERDLGDWRNRKAKLLQELAALRKPVMAIEARMSRYVYDKASEATASMLALLEDKMARFPIDIRQIHVKDVDLVDRCESCHLGIREPITLTARDLGERVFASHPSRELLRIHDPERFGCTPCHNGNGIALSERGADSSHKTRDAVRGHGRHKYWLWPMYYPENVQAGCQHCHAREIVTEHASTLNRGRELFRLRGCMGCHRYEGFDRDNDELTTITQQLRIMEQQRAEFEREIAISTRTADSTRDNSEAQRLYAHADNLRVRISGLQSKGEQFDMRSRELLREVKKIGPSLKEMRVKLRKEWIPVWVKNPHQWRPGTKMPTFRLADEEVRAISAFLWQSGVPGSLPRQPSGDAVRGKEAFETRGCLACHSMGEGNQREGGDFAANLSRVGEKVNYDYLVRWIHNPRERTLPYCRFEKRDLTEADYKKKGLPFVFDQENSRCPNDGHELLVQQMTPMPSLRLTVEESRDVASFLMTRKRGDAAYAQASYLDDTGLRNRGEFLVRHYGCAACHEIARLEEEQRIGTELTKEGSKPLERLDFALLGHDFSKKGIYNHKGFFESKLRDPAVYDQGKEKTDPLERLKMPNFNLGEEEVTALTTFLMGSVDSILPPRYHNNPADQRQDIIEGWWVVRKYNCMGCHQLMLGQSTVFMNLARYQDPDWKDQRPPSLLGEGARVSPEWLKAFLSNPAMGAGDNNRNGVRTYLRARMPTFYFSDGELRKLVRFFEALSSQAQPYIQTRIESISDQERSLARALFTSEGAPCLKCHATGDPAHDRTATAPNFMTARERLKPGWTRRWMLEPQMIMPGTAMPSGLFTREGDRWIFAGPLPAGFQNYSKDHADLVVRYMFHFTADELGRLRAGARSGAGSGR